MIRVTVAYKDDFFTTVRWCPVDNKSNSCRSNIEFCPYYCGSNSDGTEVMCNCDKDSNDPKAKVGV